MKLNVIGQNQTEIILNSGDKVFFSYNTPVAAWIDGNPYKTLNRYSKSTTKHINNYFAGFAVILERKQSFFDNLIQSI
ncbi:MAG: hypothetical protein ACOCVF_04140 [bacterium]